MKDAHVVPHARGWLVRHNGRNFRPYSEKATAERMADELEKEEAKAAQAAKTGAQDAGAKLDESGSRSLK